MTHWHLVQYFLFLYRSEWLNDYIQNNPEMVIRHRDANMPLVYMKGPS
jgi:hypothetical protein